MRGSGGRLTKVQATTGPDNVRPEVWTQIGKAAQKREKQEWANEKSKLDNARRLRGIYFIDPDDEEYKEILTPKKTRGENWKDLWHQSCRVKEYLTAARRWLRSRKMHPRRIPEQCTVEAHESTGQRVEPSLPKKQRRPAPQPKDTTRWHIAIKVRKFIPMPQAINIPDAKAAVDKEWKKLETTGIKLRAKRRSYWRDKKTNGKSTLLHWWTHAISKKAELEPNNSEAQRSSRTSRWHCKRRLWSLRSFYWTGLVCVPDDRCKSCGCYCEIARMCWTSSWRSISLHSGKIGECSPNWERLFVHRRTWMISKWLERSRIWLPCERNWWNMWTLTNPHHFLTMCTWDALSGNTNRMKQSLNSNTKMFESRIFCWTDRKITGMAETSRTNRGVVLRHGRTRSKMRWAILWIGKQESGATSLTFASLFRWSSIQTGGTGVSGRVVRSLVANCLKKKACTWHELDDLTFHGLWNKLSKISHKMDSGMWQAISKIDFSHW